MASRTLEARLIATDNMSPAFQKAGNAAEQLGSTLNGLGKKGGGFDGLLKQIKALDSEITSVGKAMTGMGAALTAALAVPMAAGTKAAFQQVRAVQQATVALSAYEKDASKVEQVLQDLVAYAQSDLGVLFQREDLFAAAQGLKVMGAETENLVEYVEIMSRAVGLGTVSWDELGMVIGRVLATGKLAGNEFDELTKAGYQLDPALRNAAVSADELFDALGRGIPADAMLGQVDTIDGQLVRFRSSVRALGQAILQVDSETSQFVEGGLGDRLVNGIGQAREVMLSLQPTAAAVGEALAVAAGGVSAAVDIFLALPQPVQTAIASMTGLSGVALLAGGSLLLLVPRIAETVSAIRALNAAMGASGVIGALRGGVGAFGAYGAAATIATVAVGGMVLKTREMINASEDLNATLRELRLEGLDDSADQLEEVRAQINGLIDDLGEGNFDWLPFGTGGIEVPPDIKKGISEVLTQAVTDSRVDYEAFFDYIRTEIASLDSDEAKMAFLRELSDPDILIQFRSEVDETAAAIQRVATAGDLWKSGIDTVFTGLEDGEAALAALNDRATELTTTLDDLRIGGDFELANQLEQLNELMLENADSSEEYLAAQDRINGALQDGSINYATVGAEIASLNAQLDAGTITQEEYEARIISLSQNLANYTDGSRNAREATAELTAEFANAALALGGWDNALSRLNMTGMTGEVGMFAEEWSRANLAMENSFRIIVGNTNAIIQQVDGIQSWADSLINVRGELGEIDNLIRDGFIDQTIYDNAQNAYDQIAVSTGNIRGNLLAVQAIQAPWIAEVVAGTERWAAELRNMPEDVQRTTLAFMDLQTVTQAQELITLGNSEAFRAMGAEGRDAFEATIQGALQVNPLLFDVLKTMGIISGTPLDFEVNYDALSEAGSAMDQLITSVDNLVDTLRQIHGLEPLKPEVDMSEVEAAASPGGPLGLLKAGFENLRDEPFRPKVEIEGSEEAKLDASTLRATMVELDGTIATPDVQMGDGTGGAVQDIETLRATMIELDGTVANVSVNAVPGSAAVGDGTGGAQNWNDILSIPETVDTLLTVSTSGDDALRQVVEDLGGIPESTPATLDIQTTGLEDVTTAQETIDALDDKTVTVDIVIGTNELDTGLAQFGIGTGGGGGPAGYTAPSVTVNVEADASDAIAQLEGVAGAAAAADALSVNIPAGAPGAEDASQKLEYLAGRAAAADALSVTVPVDTPGSETGIAQLQGVAGAAAAADAMSVTIPVSVSGAYTAIAQLNDVANAAANANRTVTITTYHRTVGVGVTAQHGGIPSYATGGVLFRGAEGNRPEIAHFANGGTALLPRDGLYMAPPMTYISPHNSSTSYGGDTIYETTELHIHGNVYGIDDLAEAFEGAVSRRRRAYGLEANA